MGEGIRHGEGGTCACAAPCCAIHTLTDMHFRLKVMLGTSGLAERIQEREAAIREANGRVNVLEEEQER